MANWVIKSTDLYLSLIYDRMHELIYDSKVIHADETPVKVMRINDSKVPGGKKTNPRKYGDFCLSSTHVRGLTRCQLLDATAKAGTDACCHNY